jgi:hypothetical protein
MRSNIINTENHFNNSSIKPLSNLQHEMRAEDYIIENIMDNNN